MHGALRKVDHAFGEVIGILESEERSQGSSPEEDMLLQKFKDWRDQLDLLRGQSGICPPVQSPGRVTSRSRSPEREGGLFTD